ncbi:filamentous hemagglutinin N-terminal domain-containing protein [Aerosakkonemataceae cyanobacterium BLCC-F50]|uniref:Filamentous hemagglutinin N-terminal domain-containing protein n=1 Tax=Floridaenema flaviceps BLCC-F50 TaxID=3153642 RepID=A0ABV4XML7_9CYAN
MKKQNNNFLIAGLVYLCFLAKTDLTQAQITSDGTLSTNVQTTNYRDFTINNGNRIGSNLFHSFGEFSVPTGGSASFTNDLDVKNIISRVTGTSISNIDGLLRTKGSANLFLINPNGIIFGSNAELNIGGSFVASTASHLLFADGTAFSATNSQTPPLLTVSVPIGLQFGQTAKPIQIEGSKLEVPTGTTLVMLGGDLLIKGDGVIPPAPRTDGLVAPAGRIELGSVASNSFVSLTPIASGWILGYKGVQNFQDIRLSQAALIDTSGEGYGGIQLRGREIVIADRSQVGSLTMSEKPGQPLNIKASESVEVSDRSILIAYTYGAGTAGDIRIETRRLLIRNGGSIGVSTYSSGLGGNLIVNASESVEVLGSGFATSLSTASLGYDNDAGNAGTVQISTKNLILRDGGRISTSTFGAGNGGTIRVDASESVQASGQAVLDQAVVDINLPSGLLAESTNRTLRSTTGNGGNLVINTPRLFVQGGASISVAAINSSTGRAGILEINSSDSVTVTGSGINTKGEVVPSTLLARSEGFGSAGDLRINTESLTVRDGAVVSVSNTGSGTTGDLQIKANNLLLDNQGKLTAETTGGQGNIILNSGNLILRRGSQITTSARGTNITGSNIIINTDVLAALKNSDISANSQDFRGGNVRINASGIFGTQLRDRNTSLSDITATGASSQLNGTVQINTPDVDPNSGLIELSVDFVDPTQLIATGCPANQGNSFTVTGRGGLPPLPNEPLRPNNTISVDWVDNTQEQRSREIQEQRVNSPTTNYPIPTTQENSEIVEATGWVRNDKGQVILISSTPSVTTNSTSFIKPSCP